jgi:hypothetical protein
MGINTAFYEPEEYEMVYSDGRRFIIRTEDPETAKRNFPVPGEAPRVMSIKPIMRRENLVTAQELAEILAAGGDKAPKWRTLLSWAQNGLIPYRQEVRALRGGRRS